MMSGRRIACYKSSVLLKCNTALSQVGERNFLLRSLCLLGQETSLETLDQIRHAESMNYLFTWLKKRVLKVIKGGLVLGSKGISSMCSDVLRGEFSRNKNPSHN